MQEQGTFDGMNAFDHSGAGKRSADVRTAIDENLKRVYDEVLDEGIPDRFRDLLAQLGKESPDKSAPEGDS